MVQYIFTRPEIFVPLCFFAVAALWLICATLVKIHKQSIDARLKESMLDRGLSADEIRTIISCHDDADAQQHHSTAAKPPAKPLPSKTGSFS